MKKLMVVFVAVAALALIGSGCAAQQPQIIYQSAPPAVEQQQPAPAVVPPPPAPVVMPAAISIASPDEARANVLYRLARCYGGNDLKVSVGQGGSGKTSVVSGGGVSEGIFLSNDILKKLDGLLADPAANLGMVAVCPKQAAQLSRVIDAAKTAAKNSAPVAQVAQVPVVTQNTSAVSGCQDQPFCKIGFWTHVMPGDVVEIKWKAGESLYKISRWSVGETVCSPIDCYKTTVAPTLAEFSARWGGGTWVLERTWTPADGGQYATIAIFRRIN